MLDPRFVAKLNTGRCFALVGSGPSCEMGYPSWKALAVRTFEYATSLGKVDDPASYNQCLSSAAYPELFKLAAYDLGGKAALCGFLKQSMAAARSKTGAIYESLAHWPFACYLTTNYDDEIQQHLSATGQHYTVRLNRPEDLAVIRHDSSNLIVKLHGDLDNVSQVVLTSDDYRKFETSPAGDYFRTKLRSVMEMFDVCIIGHSFADADLKLILQAAKETSSPKHPVFMIVAGFTRFQQREAYERYNIAIIPYDNADGHHAQLRRVLTSGGKYVAKRGERPVAHAVANDLEIEAATSLLLFSRLQEAKAEGSPALFSPLVLQALANAPGGSASADILIGLPPVSTLSVGADLAQVRTAIDETVVALRAEGAVEQSPAGLLLSTAGAERIRHVSAIRKLEAEQALGQFGLSLRHLHPGLTESELSQCTDILEQTIVQVFKSRGLALASSLFTDSRVTPEDLTDMFASVSRAVAPLPEGDIRSAFAQAAHDFLLEPNEQQKRYLTSISQGYFLYHLAGLDPTCSKLRRDAFRSTVWLCDSNFMLPLMARGCSTHAFALDLLKRLKQLGCKLFVTRRMLNEAWDHLQWAARFTRNHTPLSPTFLAAALSGPGYEQNFFLDGFICLAADGIVTTAEDYLHLICGKRVIESQFGKCVSELGITITDLQLVQGYSSDDEEEVEHLAADIKRDRVLRSTFRSEEQVEAEAEVLALIHGLRSKKYEFGSANVERVYFISNSLVLDRISEEGDVITWTPESAYRYLASLPSTPPPVELLHECLLHSYYDAGVTAIDSGRYRRFFSSYINAANLSLKQEKERYFKVTEETYHTDIEKVFRTTPDLEKPLFVNKIGWQILEISENAAKEARSKAVAAEKQVKSLLEEKRMGWRKSGKARVRQLAAETKNQADSKHVRKRARQKRARDSGKRHGK